MNRPTSPRLSALALAASLIALSASGAPSGPPSPAGTDDDGVWLITGGTVLVMDEAGTVFEEGAVAIRGDSIVAVGPAAAIEKRHPGAHRVDATGRIVLPGLVNAHTHLPMTLFRGLADDVDLVEFLEEVIFPAEATWVDEEFVRVGTRLGCLELLRGGVTTFVDMYYFEDAVAEEAVRCGIRAVVGETLIDFPSPDHETWDGAMAYTEAFVERWKGHPLVVPAVAPHAAYTVSGPHLRAAHALAARHDVPLLIHLAEAPSEIEQVRGAHGMGSVEYLASLGILDERVVAAHVVLPSDAEIGMLADAGVGVVHCPQSNMKTAAGVAPVPDLLAAGIAVGLGTDGPASNNDLSLWEEVDTAAKLHKVHRLDPTVMPAPTVLAMATRLGAEAIGLGGRIGTLEAGKRADLVVAGTDGLHQVPAYDPYSALAYTTKATDVETVVVNGRIVVANGKVLTLDEDAVRRAVEGYRRRIAGEQP